MDYANIGSVRQLLDMSKQLFEEPQVIEIATKSLQGLAYLHAKSLNFS